MKGSAYLKDSAYVFKFIGPVKVKQYTFEAKINVDFDRCYLSTKKLKLNEDGY